MNRGGGPGRGGGNLNGTAQSAQSPLSRKVPQSPTGTGLGSLSLQEKESGQEFASTTTFVQVDTSSFREVVQKLTGASDPDVEKLPITLPSRHSARGGGEGGLHRMDHSQGGLVPKPVNLSARRPPLKLHERRHSNLRKLDVKGLSAAAAFRSGIAGFAASSPTSDLSPRFPSCIASPVTPLTKDIFENVNAPTTPTSYEAHTCPRPREATPTSTRDPEAVLERDSYFHMQRSPSERPRQTPELLTLFPLSSPRSSETS